MAIYRWENRSELGFKDYVLPVHCLCLCEMRNVYTWRNGSVNPLSTVRTCSPTLETVPAVPVVPLTPGSNVPISMA